MIRSLNIWLSAWGLVAALFAFANTAEAQAKRVAIMKFEGQSASAVQSQISNGLKGHREVEIVSSRELAHTASRLDNNLRSDTDFREVGEALELSAIIEGDIVKDRKGRDLIITVRVRNAATGEVVHEQTWKKRRSQVKQLKGAAWDKLGPAIEETSPPVSKGRGKGKTKPTPPPPPVEEPDPEEGFTAPEEIEEPPPPPKTKPRREVSRREESDDESDDGETKSASAIKKSALHPALHLEVGPRLLLRKLGKYDGETNLASYGGSPAPQLAYSLRYFPGAHKSTRWYSNLGIEHNFNTALAYKTSIPASATGKSEAKVTAYELGFGLVYRIPIGDFEPHLHLGYVKQVFKTDMSIEDCPARTTADLMGQEPDPVRCIPNMDYNALRIGAGTDIRIVDFITFDVAFAYLYPFAVGELSNQNFAPNVETSGWEANAGLMLRIKEVYGMRLGLDYRRYKHDFSISDNKSVTLPKTGTDSYLGFGIYFVYMLPGAVQ